MDRNDAEEEFREFVVGRLDRLRHLAFLMCGDMHRAEDVVQQSLAKLYAVWHRVDPVSVDAYCRRIVINQVRTHQSRAWWRRERTTGQLPDQHTADDNAQLPDRVVILRALARLPNRQRAVMVLRFWEDRSIDETAQIMNCSTGSVKSHTSRGIKALRELLSDTYSNHLEMAIA